MAMGKYRIRKFSKGVFHVTDRAFIKSVQGKDLGVTVFVRSNIGLACSGKLRIQCQQCPMRLSNPLRCLLVISQEKSRITCDL